MRGKGDEGVPRRAMPRRVCNAPHPMECGERRVGEESDLQEVIQPVKPLGAVACKHQCRLRHGLEDLRHSIHHAVLTLPLTEPAQAHQRERLRRNAEFLSLLNSVYMDVHPVFADAIDPAACYGRSKG